MFILTAASGSTLFELAISGSTQDYNVHSQLETQEGETITDPYNLEISIAAVTVGASNTSNYALDFNDVPSGSNVTVTMTAGSYIVGRGGTGGNAGGSAGTNGGPAVRVPAGVTVTFGGSGTIGSGGGGGGGGGNPARGYNYRVYQISDCTQTSVTPGAQGGTGGGGGGGAGDSIGTGGTGNAGGGSDGTVSTGGSGSATQAVGSISFPADQTCQAGIQSGWAYTAEPGLDVTGANGGAGGDLGQNGTASTGAGGTAGTSIQGYSNTTVGGGITVSGPTAG